MHFLLVEDDSVVARALVRVLGVYGDVDHAADVAQARLCLEGRRYDVIVSDYQLPDGTGAELLANARERAPSSRRLLLSAEKTLPGEAPPWERAFRKPEDVGALLSWVGSFARERSSP